MTKYMNNCKRIGEVIPIMEVSDHVVDINTPATTTKKRKIFETFRLKSHNGVADTSPENLLSPATVGSSDEPAGSSTSCCSSNSKSLDLDENGVEVTEKEKMSSSNERREESEQQKSKKMAQNESRIPEKIPSNDELEAFFARREKERLKRFREKYNFDFEKEEPLEGRYKWVQIYEN